MLFILIGILVLIWLQNKTTNHIHVLLRQTARWAIASEQDLNPLIAVLHANYAVGYLSALREIATDQEIQDASGIDLLAFQHAVQSIQDQATKKASRECPSFAPRSSLTAIAGNR